MARTTRDRQGVGAWIRPLPALAIAAAFVLTTLAIRAASGAVSEDWPTPAVQQDSPPLTFVLLRPNENNFLLCAVRLDRRILAEDLPTYLTSQGMLLPLGELARLLDLAIVVEPAEGRATGSVVVGQRRLTLDLARNELSIDGRPQSFDRRKVEPHADDIYVDAALLSAWLDIPMVADRYASLITITPRSPLPLQLRWDREERHAVTDERRSRDSGRPRLVSPYRLFDGGSVDQTITLSGASSPELATAALRYSTLVAGDVGYLNGYFYLSGTDQRGDYSTNYCVGRTDPDGRLLGPLRAGAFQVGSVSLPYMSLLPGLSGGRGLLISSQAGGRSSYFDNETFRGVLPAGWDVELYRDQQLLGHQSADQNEAYAFEGVPLYFGNNHFRLVFYGPHGERRVEERDYRIGSSMLRPGEGTYRLAMTERDGWQRTYCETDYGVSRALTLNAAFARLDSDDGTHDYAVVGGTGYYNAYAVDCRLLSDLTHGAWGGDIGLRARIAGLGVNLRHTRYTAGQSAAGSTATTMLESRTQLRVDGIRWWRSKARSPLYVELQADRGRSRTVSTGSLAWSQHNAGVSYNHRLQWGNDGNSGSVSLPSVWGGLSQTVGTSEARWRAESQVSRRLDGWGYVRAWANYDLDVVTLRTLSASLESELGAGRRGTGSLAYDFAAHRMWVSAGLSRDAATHTLSYFTTYASGSGLRVGMQLSTSLIREPRDGKITSDSRPNAMSGAVSVRTFLDLNRNGRKDPDEELLENVGIAVGDRGSLSRTNAQGVALLRYLPRDEPLEVSIAPGALDDPAWAPATIGVQCVPRAGKVIAVDLPVVTTGEITGTVYMYGSGVARAMAGISLELVAADGQIVKRTRTAYDGFFDITGIAPGQFTLRVSPEQARTLSLSAASRAITVAPEGGIADGLDLALAPSDAPPAEDQVVAQVPH